MTALKEVDNQHGHSNCLILDLGECCGLVSIGSRKILAIQSKEERKPLSHFSPVDVHHGREPWEIKKKMDKSLGGMRSNKKKKAPERACLIPFLLLSPV